MAPTIRPAQHSASSAAGPSLAKQVKRQGDEEEDLLDRQSDVSDDDMGAGQGKQGGAGAVSKRTLQNRKAQREFRKRREARVRELEERCRRYDQMGLEANSELQRVARGLKDENMALRGFIIRLGYGHAIPNILQNQNSGGNQHLQMQQMNMIKSNENPFISAPSFSNSAFMGGNNNGGQYPGPTFFMDPTAGSDNANNVSHSSNFGSDMSPPSKTHHSVGSTTLAPTPNGSMLLGAPKSSSPNKTDSAGSDHSGEQGRSDTPLLSLNLSQQNQRQQNQQRQQDAQTQAEYSQRITAQSLNALFPGGAGSGGTAMLANMNNGSNANGPFGPYPIPKRSQQNAALLNPNPIPFAFNLSSGMDPANSQPTWWEQMGGGADGVELDDKAQAVANAQTAGAQQPHSPFDLSVFLQGGLTPNGGFQLGNIGSSQGEQAGAVSKGTPLSESGRSGADTDHMRLFIQLMERKMAERDARTYASLGFQPPSQDPAHRAKQEERKGSDAGPTITVADSLTPSGVYSRLSQHPAFLSTNAQEMQELVDALDNSSDWKGGDGDIEGSEKEGSVKSAGSKKRQGSGQEEQASQDSSPRSRRSTDASVHVDEGGFGKLFGLLDKKSSNAMLRSLSGNNTGMDHRLSMVMT